MPSAIVPPSGSGSAPLAWTCVTVAPMFAMLEQPAPPVPVGVLPPPPEPPIVPTPPPVLSPHPGPAIANERTAAPSDQVTASAFFMRQR